MFFFLTQAASGQIVTYEGSDAFPEDAGWMPNPWCDPGRWLSDGWFFQHVEQCDGFPPGAGQHESFTRYLQGFIGGENFFIDFRVQTDGDRSEIFGIAPASLSAGGFTGVNYQFVIARDRVQFWRDNFLPIVWIDIDPNVPHTYRLELFSDQLYVWYLDGDVVDSGTPEGAYPTDDGDNIIWRAGSWFLESTTRWDYIRYGRIADDGSGDFDSDGFLAVDDFYFFQECRSNSGPSIDAGPGCRWADMDQDTDVDAHDFALFQRAFTGPE